MVAKKTAPRKTAPRKATVRNAAPTAEADGRVQRIEAFEQLLERGRGFGWQGVEPYVLGPEQGFDPPIRATYPRSLQALDEIDRASRRGDTIAILRILFSEDDYFLVISRFDAYAAEHDLDSVQLLYGLGVAMIEHFMGGGASEVGGTRAS